MQAETKILFAKESKAILGGILNFKKDKLKPTTTVVRKIPVIAKASTKEPEVKKEAKKRPLAPLTPLKGPTESLHGLMGRKEWDPPLMIFKSEEVSRPGYDDHTKASEYLDQPDVLKAKVKILAGLILKSKAMCTYTGAGISTAAGVDDYASKGGLHTAKGVHKARSPFDAQPTLSHRVLAALHEHGHLKHWVQQNHDGLPQKAGYPQRDLNEIHGAWYDPSNPVVMMSGELRPDLFNWLLEWEETADLLLVLGTSLSGMNADRMVTSCGRRYAEGKALGSVIVSLQQTQKDSVSSIRIFSTIDKVMELLAEEMKIAVPEPVLYAPNVPKDYQIEEHVWLVPYDKDGKKTSGKRTRLDLREDAKVKLTLGQFAGDFGVVMGQHREGHYRIQFRHEIGGKKRSKKSFKAPMVRMYGLWYVEALVKGELGIMPVVNCE